MPPAGILPVVTALSELQTPAALVDVARMNRNIERMQQRMNALSVRLRPHVKTPKSVSIARAQLAAGARGITVSTLAEAEQFHADGFNDILYAVGIVPAKLPRILALRRQGCELSIVTDNLQAAQQLAAFGREHSHVFDVMLEIDTDDHRSGLGPDSPALLDVARALHAAGMRLQGVMTHAGSSYEYDTTEALVRMAEQERAGCVAAAERLRTAGLPCPEVSVGSTPTALSAANLQGVTEVRAGVYVFFDLVMCNVGVCTPQDIALSVLTSVIGHQEQKGWALVDAGWMAMSRDRGTERQKHDYFYGQVCSLDGNVIPGYLLTGVNQEHGIVSCPDRPDPQMRQRFPIGTLLRILPIHACATAAQFSSYQAMTGESVTALWRRIQGW
jgi:D-serine deaminase-like pyridoxal phosphate-dependent protein